MNSFKEQGLCSKGLSTVHTVTTVFVDKSNIEEELCTPFELLYFLTIV